MNQEPHSARHPDDFKDPTFTPLREEGARFTKVQPPPEQKKKEASDPDWNGINPDIIRLCQRNGMARGCLNLYLEGQLTWMEALEMMVVALGKELVANQDILVEQRNEYLDLVKATERHQSVQIMDRSPEENRHEEFFKLLVLPVHSV